MTDQLPWTAFCLPDIPVLPNQRAAERRAVPAWPPPPAAGAQFVVRRRRVRRTAPAPPANNANPPTMSPSTLTPVFARFCAAGAADVVAATGAVLLPLGADVLVGATAPLDLVLGDVAGTGLLGGDVRPAG